ncbi:MAG TPA: hypothetical protein VFE17_12370 [Candidatus Baltobacteraceae bacterium]|nr:hypothetical protein [Candidatus Baltobacteraceae bacterium]
MSANPNNPNPQDHGDLLRSMTKNFTGVYLTMLSIIQGVALTDLSNVAFSEHSHFRVVHWLEVAVMLWSIVYIWNHFMGDALMTHWVPDLEDAALLFGTGVFELVANHAIVWGVTAWLATLALMLLAWCAGTHYIRRQEISVVQDSHLQSILRERMRPLRVMTFAGGALLGALAITCGVAPAHITASTEQALAFTSVIIALAISLAIGITSSSSFRRVRHYAYTGDTS